MFCFISVICVIHSCVYVVCVCGVDVLPVCCVAEPLRPSLKPTNTAPMLNPQQAQRKVDAEKRTLDEITERVFSETARFRKEKKVNFKNAMVDFVRMQIEHAKRVQNAWESILPELEGLPFDG